MKKYRDERFQFEMLKIESKLFRYMISCFVLIFSLKLAVLDNYGGFEKVSDNFILITTVLYASYIKFRSESDFYTPDKYIRAIIGATLVGVIVMLAPMKANDFQFSFDYVVVYLLAFLNGVLVYMIAHFIGRVIRRWRHNSLEKQFIEE